MDTPFALDGRAALVTGAARGLGQSLALGLAEAGADQVILDRDALDESCNQVASLGRRSHGIRCDLRELTPETARAVVGECLDNMERLDILVNNAGIISRTPAVEFNQKDWEDTIAINLTSAFYLSQAAARHFVDSGEGGKIINVVSMLSFQGGVLVPAYTATKSGLAGLTKAMANEWAGLGINVNAIAPGYMATEVTAEIRADQARSQSMLERIPAGRWGTPEDLKGVVVFLASEAASYVHGTIVPVDGGWLAR